MLKNLVKKSRLAFLVLPMMVILTSCGVYSFTGASIPPEAKTVSIDYFPNKASLVLPSLSQQFTQALQDIFSAQTSLILVEKNGDLRLEGEISSYTIRPTAISGANDQGQQTGQLNRITVGVKVKFTNKFEPDKDFETTFSRYVDVPNNINLSNPTEQIDEINEQLVEDIFNRAVVNW